MALGPELFAAVELEVRLAALPERVPVKAVMDEEDIVKLAPEAKHLTDTIKMLAYRAENRAKRHQTLEDRFLQLLHEDT